MATAKKTKTATKGKASGKSTKVTRTAKIVKKKVAPRVAAKGKAAVKAKPVPKKAKATAAKSKTAKSKPANKSKPAPKVIAKARAKAKPAPTRAKPAAKVTKSAAKVRKPVAKVNKAGKNAKPTAKSPKKMPAKVPSTQSRKATLKVIPKTKIAPPKLPVGKAPAVKAAAKTVPSKVPPSPTPVMKSSKAPVSVPAALERPKTPVGKQSARATVVAAAPAPPKALIFAPTRALPKSLTVKAVHSNILPFNPKTARVEGYLSESEILKQSKDKYMSKEQLAFFKQRLLELQSQLRENAGQTTEHLRELSIVPDPADRATLEEEHALELRARDRERKLLKKVEGALVRIVDGSYGYCEETGEPIGVPRLLARPTATLTIEAQERRELKQRMFGE